jgi:hypothetical protein
MDLALPFKSGRCMDRSRVTGLAPRIRCGTLLRPLAGCGLAPAAALAKGRAASGRWAGLLRHLRTHRSSRASPTSSTRLRPVQVARGVRVSRTVQFEQRMSVVAACTARPTRRNAGRALHHASTPDPKSSMTLYAPPSERVEGGGRKLIS